MRRGILIFLASVAFLIREFRHDKPLVDLRVFRHRNFAMGCLLIGFFGRIRARGRSAYLFGLPGNPVAVMVTFYHFVRGALLYMMGRSDTELPLLRAKSEMAMRKKPGRLRPNPAFDTVTVITELRIGEALVSMLDSNGSPMPVERAFIYPPHSRMASLTADERGQVIRNSPFAATYMNVIDRESAYEQLKKKADMTAAAKVPDVPVKKPKKPAESAAGDVIGSAAKTAAHAMGSQIGREIMRGLLGSLTGTRKK